jgi:uroporphyrinogen-III decarboxylase
MPCSYYRPHWGDRGGELLQQYVLDFYDAPELMRDVLSSLRAANEKKIEALLASPIDIIFYVLSGASTSLGSPDFVHTWVVEELCWAVEKVHRVPGKLVGLYVTGRCQELLPMVVECEPDFIGTLGTVAGGASLREAKHNYGGVVALLGATTAL